MSERQLLLSLIGSLTLADHIGDVATDAFEALRQLGIEPKDADGYSLDWSDLGDWLAHNHDVTTVWGTSLLRDSDESKED